MASRQSHPLPTPPGQQSQYPPNLQNNYQQDYQTQPHQPPVRQYQQMQYPQQPAMHSAPQRPRPKSRTLSFLSDKSRRSSGVNKIDLHETSAEKEAKRLHSKADPTLAINEAEPAAVQATVKSSLASIRNMQHKDPFGNPIADPDRSNPTRSRWERPLDTIRSFEAAIDGGYDRRSMYRSDADSVANWNRRSSYYGSNAARFPQDGYYSNRPATLRPESQYDMRQQGGSVRDSYFDQQGYNNGMPPVPPIPPAHGRHRYSRMASEPQFHTYGQSAQKVYPIPNNHRSYETVASASGSGTSAEPAGYQTDPTSSDNSSIERVQSPPKHQPQQEPGNDYGIGFSQSAAYQPQAFTVGINPSGINPQQPNAFPGATPGPPPPVPQKDPRGVIMRKPILAASNGQIQARPDMGEKRKSWFSRRFSKQL